MLAIATALLVAAMAPYFPAPTYDLWVLSLLVSEHGHALMPCAVLLLAQAVCSGLKSLASRLQAAASVLALLLLALPMVRTGLYAGEAGAVFSWRELFFGAADARVQVLHDLAFGQPDGKTLFLDYYRLAEPTENKPPVMVIIHGGGWVRGRRSDFQRFDRWLASLGIAVFDIDYRLAREGSRFPAQNNDVREAIEWIKSHARELDVDASRVGILGRSAGGQLALAVAYGAKDPSVKCVISLYGPTDLRWGYYNVVQPDVIRATYLLETYLGGTPASLPDAYRDASPIHLVEGASPPTLLIHGLQDQLVSARHVGFLASRLAEKGVPSETLLLPCANHGFDINFSGLNNQLARQRIRSFLFKHLGAGPAHFD